MNAIQQSTRPDDAQAAPDVSVIIAQRNQAAYLGEAIESALAQTGCSIEVIVVDDGSDDDSRVVARRYPTVILLEQSAQGACAARNHGIARSSGRHLVFLDGDDRMLPGAVEAGLAALARNPQCAMAYGSFSRISAQGAYLSTSRLPTDTVDHYAHFLLRNPIVLHAAIFRRDAVERSGGFVAKDWLAADYDLYLRVMRDFQVVCHGEVIAERRIHTSQASRSDAPMLGSVLRVLGRQWTHARRQPKRQAAYLAGRKHYQDWFGGRLVTETHLVARRGQWLAVLTRFATLVRYYPQGAMAFLRGLRKSPALVFRVAAEKTEPAPASFGAPAVQVPAGDLDLLALDPPSAVVGEAFFERQGDHGILKLVCRNANANTVVIFDGVPLETFFQNEQLLLALVPVDCLRYAGNKAVYLLK